MVNRRSPAKDRLLANIEVRGECWEWQRHIDRHGYGRFKMGGRDWLAHRAAYTLLKGPIPEGMTIDHLCQNTRCVNPDHLEPVTDLENKRRSPKCKKTHCKWGHEYTPENTYRSVMGWRHCKTCALQSAAKSQAKAREQARFVCN